MPRTCLIFSIQLNPNDLIMIQDILADIQTAQRKLQFSIKKDWPINFLSFEPIISDFRELILEAKNNNFRFNAYILKLAILKIEKCMYDIQVSTDNTMLETYNILQQSRVSLNSILDDLISPF